MSVTNKIVISQRTISTLAKLLEKETQNEIGNKMEEAERVYREDKWLFVVLAVDLCSNLEKVKKIKKALKEKKMNGVQAFVWILIDWINANGNNATLDNLLSILVSNGLRTLAGTIEDAFIMSLAAKEKAKLNQAPLDLSVNYTEEMKIYLTNAVFGNRLIQNILVSKLPITTQKNMRLASAQWARDNLSHWRKSVWVRINSNPIQYEYDGVPQPTVNPLNLQQLFDLFKQSDEASRNYISSMEEHPFRRFHIIKETITKTNLSSGENFWKIFGPSITHLKFEECYVPDGQKFLELMQWLFSTCPKVEEMTLFICNQLEEETDWDISSEELLDLIVSQDTLPWFIDLSPFTFENLKRFEVRIERKLNFYGESVKFDMGTLRALPNLEALSISYFYKNMGRAPGVGDWLYQGERELFIPEGMKVKLPKETAPMGENLQNLEVYGWKLNSSDISLFQGWFPQLKSINASFDKEAFQGALEWNGIEAITVDQHCKIYFRELYEAKEKHERIRIFKDKGAEGIVEVVKEGHKVFLKNKNNN